jgi:nicotinamidase/pyrazinamidase
VKFTALDSLSEGFETTVIKDACRAVNLDAGDEEAAYQEMKAAGVKVVKSDEI